MKKMLVLVMVLVAASTSAFALNTGDYNVFYKMNDNTTFKGLVRYLNADGNQADNLKYIFKTTENELKAALQTDNEAAAEKAINSNFKNIKEVLTSYQYKKYLTIVNLTINNRYSEVLLTEN